MTINNTSIELDPKFKRNTPKQLIMDFNCPAEQLYYDDLPYRPFCTDDFNKDGLYRLRRDLAIEKPIVQHNPEHLVRVLVFDMDKPKDATIFWNPVDHWRDVGAPEPNWIVINPINGNAHYYYMLTTPVPLTEQSRKKPRDYVAAIERALKIKLQADLGYVGLVSKNPLHLKWDAITPRLDTYSLQELAEYVNLKALPKVGKREYEGLGRHCILFDELRWWSYTVVDDARENMSREQWRNQVVGKAQALNTFNNPLPHSSIMSTAKSVSNWSWDNYTGSGRKIKRGRDSDKNHQLELGDKQTYAAIKTNEQRIETTIKKIETAVRVLIKENKRTSIRAIAELSGLSKTTVQKHKEIIKKCTSTLYIR